MLTATSRSVQNTLGFLRSNPRSKGPKGPSTFERYRDRFPVGSRVRYSPRFLERFRAMLSAASPDDEGTVLWVKQSSGLVPEMMVPGVGVRWDSGVESKTLADNLIPVSANPLPTGGWSPGTRRPASLPEAKKHLSYAKSVLTREAADYWKPPYSPPRWLVVRSWPVYGNEAVALWFDKREHGGVASTPYAPDSTYKDDYKAEFYVKTGIRIGEKKNPPRILKDIAGWDLGVYWDAPYLVIGFPDGEEQAEGDTPFVYHAEDAGHAQTVKKTLPGYGGWALYRLRDDGKYEWIEGSDKVAKKMGRAA